MNNDDLLKSLNDYELKVKKLNFCKTIIECKNPFSVATKEVDADVVNEVSLFIKESIKRYAESIISGDKKPEAPIDESDWGILRGLISGVKRRAGTPDVIEVEPVQEVKDGIVVANAVKKKIPLVKSQIDRESRRAREMAAMGPQPNGQQQMIITPPKKSDFALPGMGVMLDSGVADEEVSDIKYGSVIAVNHAVMDTQGAAKSDIPLDRNVKIVSEMDDYYQCFHSDSNKAFSFRIPKEDIEIIQ